MESKRIAIGKLTPNKGQIEGLPANPRQWTQTDIEGIGGFEKFAEWGLI